MTSPQELGTRIEQEFAQVSEKGRPVEIKKGLLGRQIIFGYGSRVQFQPADSTNKIFHPSDDPLLRHAKEVTNRLGIHENQVLNSMELTYGPNYHSFEGNVVIYEEDGEKYAVINMEEPTVSQQPSRSVFTHMVHDWAMVHKVDELRGWALLGPENPHRITDIRGYESEAHLRTVDALGSAYDIHLSYGNQPLLQEQKEAAERATKYQELVPTLEFLDRGDGSIVQLHFERGGQLIFLLNREDVLRSHLHEQVGGYDNATVEELETFLEVLRLSPDAQSRGIVELAEQAILERIKEKVQKFDDLAKNAVVNYNNAVEVYNRVAQPRTGERN